MINIQKPTKEDVVGIQEVFYKTWLETYPNEDVGIIIEDVEERFKNRKSQKVINKRTQEILNIPDGSLFLIAKDGDNVVGVCRAKKGNEVNELMAIYVLPEYQRSGVGKMFWDEAIKFWGDENDIIVHVASYNKKAINFYKKVEFVDGGKRFIKEGHRMPISKKCIPEMEMVIRR
jgi:ribosomal protein S18 acetylase RimI-like enzyme